MVDKALGAGDAREVKILVLPPDYSTGGRYRMHLREIWASAQVRHGEVVVVNDSWLKDAERNPRLCVPFEDYTEVHQLTGFNQRDDYFELRALIDRSIKRAATVLQWHIIQWPTGIPDLGDLTAVGAWLDE